MKKIFFLILWSILFQDVLAQNPTFQWARSFGGASNDEGYSLAVDSSGNVYTIGYFQGTVDFDPGPGTYFLTSFGLYDYFISKIDASGNFVWARQLGGPSIDTGLSVAVDGIGNVYASGLFKGTGDFDPGSGVLNLTSSGGYDAFICKLDPMGNLIWAKSFGGSSDEYTYSVKVDAVGNVYLAGRFESTVDFDPGIGTSIISSFGGSDIFVLKLDVFGNFVWVKQIGGSGGDSANNMTLDASANIYLTGSYGFGCDFDPSASTFTLTPTGSGDIFVSKLDMSGNLVWAKTMGGSYGEGGYSIAVDVSGNVYSVGIFVGVADFDPGIGTFTLSSTTPTPTIAWDNYISKLDPAGNFIWAKQIAGKKQETANSITIDGSSNVYITGRLQDTVDFDPGVGTYTLCSAGPDDVFIQKLDASGNFIWVKNLTGPLGAIGFDIEVGSNGDIYTMGYYSGPYDFDPDVSTYLLSANAEDVFVQKMSQGPLGLNETQNSQRRMVYPNPTNQYLNFVNYLPVENAEIEISNALGQIVLKMEYSNAIDVSILTNGIYTLKIIDRENHNYYSKFVKD